MVSPVFKRLASIWFRFFIAIRKSFCPLSYWNSILSAMNSNSLLDLKRVSLFAYCSLIKTLRESLRPGWSWVDQALALSDFM